MRTWFGSGKKLQRAVTSCCLCAFILYGYEQGVFGGILENENWLNQFNHPDDTLTGLITGSYNIGAILGCFLNFFIGEFLGRRRTIWFAMSWIIVGAALQASAYQLAHLIVGRIITGVGTGLKTSTVPMYQSELCEGKRRGRLVSQEVMFVGLGIAFAYWWDFALSFVGGAFAWRFPLAFQAVFAFWVVFVVFGVPESPRWLLNHGNNREEALRVLAAIYDKPTDHPDILEEVNSIQKALAVEDKAQASWSATFRNDKVKTRKRVFLAWFGQFMNQVGGINLVVYYVLTVLQENVGLEHRLAQIIAGCIQLMFPLGSLIPSLALDRMGRRPTMMWGSLFMGASMMFVAALLSQSDGTTRGKSFSSAAIAFFFTYMFTFGATMNCVPWVYVPEILPLHARTKGTAIGVSSNWLWNFTVVMITPILINRLQWKTYLIFTATNIVFIPIIFFLFPETSNLALEEIDCIFATDENSVSAAGKMQKQLKLHGRLDMGSSTTADEPKEGHVVHAE
ncbi:general substrate transporter [Microdochium trichocladiopsis]|uniref:General substrate transporter n=1 Tax=Microdochium trichocladiopsis TaxID=1682393 RepID=A0A9P8Y5E2_9PEZI|nr:general substrate transporter [Microdochium trichocladiopsis]KAH7028768.1 general substrate transporter [Microdochium trichocladiopsis]